MGVTTTTGLTLSRTERPLGPYFSILATRSARLSAQVTGVVSGTGTAHADLLVLLPSSVSPSPWCLGTDQCWHGISFWRSPPPLSNYHIAAALALRCRPVLARRVYSAIGGPEIHCPCCHSKGAYYHPGCRRGSAP